MPSNTTRTPGKRRLNRRGPVPLALEQRLVFDGAAGAEAVAKVVAEPVDADASQHSGVDVAPAAAAPAVAPAQSIVFVDGQLPNAGVLASNIANGAQVIVLDPTRDALQQMQDAVAGRQGIQSIHILSHGAKGEVTLGDLRLNQGNLASHAGALAAIGASLASDGDILLYGCDIGAGSEGQALVDEIARVTQADVAASANATGASQEGGDWTLEYTRGVVQTGALAFADSVDPFLLGTPSVTSVDDTTYVEGSGAVIVDNTISITGGSSYDGQYVRFSLTNGQSTDILSLTSAANVNAAGAISVSGSSVYLGNGSGRDIIGTVDATEDGTAGKALKVNFVSTFTNSGFESGTLTGWTALNQVVNLGATSIAGFVSPNDNTYPANAGNDDVYPTSPGSFSTTVSTTQYSEGTHSLSLLSSGMTTATGFDVVHGPAVYSDAFTASAGDKIYFDWRAYAGSDAYDVYGYILNTATGATTTVLDATGTSSSGSTNWATASTTIASSGTYRFVFVSGTYDFSGGRAAGASMYIDNVRVFGSKVNDAVVTSISRQVAFEATSDNPVTSPARVFTVTAMSATGPSASDTGIINITATNDAPVLGGTAQTLAYTENNVPMAIDTVMTVTDPDGPANFNGGWLQAQITTNGAAEDQLSVLNQGTGSGQIGVSGSNITYAGTVIGSIDAGNSGANGAALRINLNGSATPAAVQALARVMAYSNSSDNPSTSARTVTFTLNDGGNTGAGGSLQGTRSAAITVAAVDDPAVLTLSLGAETFNENDGSFYVDPALTLTDVDSTTLDAARVVITTNLVSAEDRLQPASGTDVSGKITYSYNTTTGILALSGTATVAEYQAALRAVKYFNTSDNPTTTARTISFTIGNAVALEFGGKTHYYEYVAGSYNWTTAKTAAEGRTFQGMSGYLATITSQAENDFIRQKLQADAWIGSSDAYTYINAATGATTFASQSASEGKWYWVTGPEKGTLISTGNGTPVTASGGYAYWNNGEPNNSGGSEHYGEIYSSGASSGKWNDLPNTSLLPYVVEYNDNGGTSSFSKTLTISPARRNDAPVNNAPAAIAGIQEDAVNNTGALVSSFLSSSDVDIGATSGIAVTGVDNSHGSWQYSLDGGATWTAFDATSAPADSAARLLRSTDRLRFVPAADFSGTATVTYRAWDRSTGTAGSTADLSAATAYGTTKAPNGDETAYSAAKQTATLTVAAVNDAPVLSAAAPSFTTLTEDQTTNAGQTVASILGTSVTDADSGASQGIAITSLASGNGSWQYSTDNGSNWSAVGSVSATSALLLRSTDKLRFIPDAKNATTGSVTYKAWDQTGVTAGQQGSKQNTGTSGGTSPYSTASDTATLTVSAVNDAPVLGVPANFAGINEDAANNAGQTVASLLGSTLTDVDTGAVQGVAITGAGNGSATGSWQYSTDGGSTWFSVGSPNVDNALLLKSSDRLRFNPDGFKGGTATLSLRGWDQSTGTATSGGTRGEADVNVNGGTAAYSGTEQTVSLVITEVNDPPVFTAPANAAAFTEGGSAVNVGSGLTLTDDGGLLSKATVAITSGFTAGDTLAVGTAGGLSVSYNSVTGVLTLTGSAAASTYQTALNSVTFVTASDDPTLNGASRTLTWRATDTASLTSVASTSSIAVTPLADAPVLAGQPATWNYTEDDGSRIVAPSLTLADADDTRLSGASVTLSGTGYLNDGRETLAAVVTGTGISASFDNLTGVLTLSGTDSVANYQKVLRSVTYTNTADYDNPANPGGSVALAGNDSRSIAWQVTDANSDGAAGTPPYAAQSSTPATTAVSLFNANETPQVSSLTGYVSHIAYTEGGAPGTLEGLLTVQDDGLVSTINSAFIRVTAGLEAGDELGFHSAIPGWTQTGTATSGILSNGSADISYSWNLASGDMALTTVSGSATQTDYTAIMRAVGFVSHSDDPTASNGTRSLIWRVTDSGGLQSAVTTAETSIIDITATNDTMSASVPSLPGSGDVIYDENGSTVTLAPSIVLVDPDDTTLAGATVVVSGAGFDPGQEYLALPGASATPGGDWTLANIGGSGINASFDHTTGTLTLSGTASTAAYETVLRQVAYGSGADDPTATAATRSISWTFTDSFGSRLTDADGGANDASSGSAGTVRSSEVTLTPHNDAPTLAGLPGAAVGYTEGGSAVTLAAAISLADVDDVNLTQARVWISGGFTAGDTLTASAGGTGIGVSYDAATGVLTLTHAGASKADFASVLQSVKFSASSNDPTAVSATRDISWQITDADASTGGTDKLASAVGSSTLAITATDNATTLSGLGSATYVEKGSPVVIAPTVALADADDTTLEGLTVSVSAGFSSGDQLTVTAPLAGTGIAASYNPATGVLTLTGTATLADYQAIARSIAFSSSNDNPTGASASRSFTWDTVSSFASRLTDADGANDTAAGTVTAPAGSSSLSITATNDAPTLTLGHNTALDASTVVFEQGGSPVYLLDNSVPSAVGVATITDPDDADIASASVVISNNLGSGDVLSVATPSGWSRVGSVLTTAGGATINVVYTAGTGTLSLTTASGQVSKAEFESLLEHVQFQNNTASPTTSGASRALTWSITDANAVSDAGGAQSASGTSYLTIRDVNDAPTIAPASSSASYTEGAASVTLPTVVVTDPDAGEIVTATLTLAQPSAGTLSVPSGASYTPGTGVWTFTGSVANVNAALAALQFIPATNNDVNTSIAISVADGGEDGATAATGSISLNVTGVNDAPVLTPSAPVLTPLTEDDTANSGQTVASFRGAIADVDSGTQPGIVITGTTDGNGHWEYRIAGGSWTAFGSVSPTAAIALADSDRVRFVPNAENATSASLSYRAWDGTGVTAGSGVNASSTGNATPFSAASDTATIAVSAVNDAPVLAAGDSTLTSISEDDTANAGQLVSALRGATTDADSGAVEGVAITGLDAGNGSWQYSTDGGTSWHTVSGVSASNALLLADSDRIRFVPNAENATAGSLSYRAWDHSTGTAGSYADTSTNGGTSAFSSQQNSMAIAVTPVNDAPLLAADAPALAPLTEDDSANPGQTVASFLGTTGSDVDAGALGGIAITATADGNGSWQYSTDGGTSWHSVSGLTGGNGLLLADSDKIRFVPDGQNATSASFTYHAWDRSTGTAGNLASLAATGGTTAFSPTTNTATIAVSAVNDAPVLAAGDSTLTSINEDDTANAGQLVSALRGATTDADSGAVQGVAITGLDAGNGSWQYSTDGGTSWHTVSGVSAGNALLLADSDRIRFVPNAENATAGSLSYRAWDHSAGTAGSYADTSINGGTSAFSSQQNSMAIAVTPVNDAPINDVPPSYSGDFRTDGSLRQDGTVTASPGLWHDVDLGDPAITYHYQWEVADDASGTGAHDIGGATAASYTLTTAEIGKFVRVKVYGSDGTVQTLATGPFVPVTNLDPQTVGSIADQDATESVPMSFTVPAGTFADANGEDTLHYSATLANGSPLPAWLHFDPLTRNFTGTPTGGDIGELQVRVTADDHGNHPASADFTLRVAGVPVKPAEVKPEEPAPPAVAPPAEAPAPLKPATPDTAWTAPAAISGAVGGAWTGGKGDGFFGASDRGLAAGSLVPTADATRTANAAAPALPVLPPADNRGFLSTPSQSGLTRPEGFRVIVQPGQAKDEVNLILARPLNDQDFKPASAIKLVVPPDTFSHTRLDARVELSAERVDGTALPAWLRFDARKGEFLGKPPADFDGDIEIKVTAKDNFGNRVSTIFRVRVHAGQRLSFDGREGFGTQLRSASAPGRDALRSTLVEHARQAARPPRPA